MSFYILWQEYVMEALSEKTVLLVTHQVDFLPAFHCCLVSFFFKWTLQHSLSLDTLYMVNLIIYFCKYHLFLQLMSDGEVLHSGPYNELLASSKEFLDLVNAHKETAGTETLSEVSSTSRRHNYSTNEIKRATVEMENQPLKGEQLIKQEEREVGDSGSKPYLIYLNQNKGYLYFSIIALSHLAFVTGQILQNIWMASGVDNPHVSESKLIVVYLILGLCSTICLLFRSLAVVTLGIESSKSLFSQLTNSLFRAPMSFYDSTPLGRILSRVSMI